jgi:glycosylphosphatidylinositol transamidase (GPIT) subunit GPI8
MFKAFRALWTTSQTPETAVTASSESSADAAASISASASSALGSQSMITRFTYSFLSCLLTHFPYSIGLAL